MCHVEPCRPHGGGDSPQALMAWVTYHHESNFWFHNVLEKFTCKRKKGRKSEFSGERERAMKIFTRFFSKSGNTIALIFQ